MQLPVTVEAYIALHSTLFILVLHSNELKLQKPPPLHSTLFILVQSPGPTGVVGSVSTFHSVYIST